MADWSDNSEFERFFKEGTDRYKFDYDPDAWDQMEVLLDRDKRRRRIIWIFLLGLFMVGGVGLWTYLGDHDHPSNSTNSIVEESSKSSEPTVDHTESNQLLNDDGVVQSDLTKSSSAQTDSESFGVSNKSVPDVGLTRNSGIQPGSPPSLDNNKTQDPPSLDRVDSSDPADISKENLTLNNSENNNPTLGIDQENTSEGRGVFDIHYLPQLGLMSLDHSITNPLLPDRSKDYLSETSAENFKKFYLGLELGIESSSTPEHGFSRVDLSTGIQLGVFLNRSWSINIGGTYTNDRYMASGNDYTASEDFWEDGVPPQFTGANCKIVRLHVGTDYYLNDVTENGLFFGLKAVSNFMLKEDYSYYFEDPSSNFKSSWTMKNKTMLSSMELSGGYHKILGDKFSLTLGPYLNIPLSGIGHGHVMLSSVGIKARINWLSH